MRSKCRTALLALIAVLALGVVATASASAAEVPEFNKTTTGQTVLGSSGDVLFHGPGRTESLFRRSSLSGEMASKTTIGSVSLLFKESGGAEGDCTNAENNKSLSVTGLNAKLGWINKAKNEVGLMFLPPKQPMAACTWDQEKVDLAGEFIGKITPVGTVTSKYTVTLSTFYNEQLPVYFEGEKEGQEVFPLAYGWCELEKGGTEEDCKHNLRAAISTSIELNFGSAVEIKA